MSYRERVGACAGMDRPRGWSGLYRSFLPTCRRNGPLPPAASAAFTSPGRPNGFHRPTWRNVTGKAVAIVATPGVRRPHWCLPHPERSLECGRP
eukprot:357811-Chlamydomonas_euryale.AAC.12